MVQPDSEARGAARAFRRGAGESSRVLEAVLDLLDHTGSCRIRFGKSQIAFVRRASFAWVWMPRTVLRGRGAPLVLSIGLGRRDTPARWKQVVEPSLGRFTHHLELWTDTDLDEGVRSVLHEAWERAG